MQPIGWDDHAGTLQFLEGKRQGILHLHGHWRSPRRVVLGSKSYGEQSDDERHKFLKSFAAIDRPTLFIGCSHEGLTDPDFSRLDSFLAEWQDVAPRRYWLIRQEIDDSGKFTPLPSPDPARRLYPLSFGKSYDELIGLLHSLAPARSATRMQVTDPDSSIRCIDQFVPKPSLFGRDDEVHNITDALLAGRPAIVAGGPGMGKTAITIAALYEPQLIAYFGRRRVFASLESAVEPRAILAKLVESLGLSPTGDEVSLLRILEANAAERPIAAILDNCETVFEIPGGESERLLRLATQIRGLSLAITIRGTPPLISNAAIIEDLPQLTPSAAQEVFVSIAGTSFANDPDLVHLLNALDGHALSLRLVAAQALGLPSLKWLRESWDETHADILRQHGEEESRQTSVRASLKLSLNSRRMTNSPHARRLLSLLAYLPGGLFEGKAQLLLGERGTVTRAKANSAIACLHQLRLVERRLDNRLRTLTPLRECIKADDESLLEGDRKRLIDRYLSLTASAQKIGGEDWDRVRDEVEAEVDNLDPICELAVQTDIRNKRVIGALFGLSELHRFSGRGTINSIHQAAERSRVLAMDTLQANCLQWIGLTAHEHSDPQAGTIFKKAIGLFQRLSAPTSEAYCMWALGKIAGSRDELRAARKYYEDALALYERVDETYGRALCISSLGKVALQRSEIGQARSQIEKALVLYRSVRRVSSEANCVLNLGQIALLKLDFLEAVGAFHEAIRLYQRVGNLHGEAIYNYAIGRVAYLNSDYATALTYIALAEPLFARLGDVSSETDCKVGRGSIAAKASDFANALKCFQEAADIFKRIGNRRYLAEVKIRMGRTLQSSGDKEMGLSEIGSGFKLLFESIEKDDLALPGWQALHRTLTIGASREAQAASAAWSAIGRLDLVQEWLVQEGLVDGTAA